MDACRALVRLVLVACLIVAPACGKHDRKGSGSASGKDASGDGDDLPPVGLPGAGTAITPLCDCEELLAAEQVRSLLGLKEPMASNGYYTTCKYRLVGEPVPRSFVSINYTNRNAVKRYDSQLLMARKHTGRPPSLRYELNELDDVGSRAYESVSFAKDRPIFMQKVFLTKDSEYMVSIHVKMKPLDAEGERQYVPALQHLNGLAAAFENNLEKRIKRTR